jgi:glycosyltransferase involved in cell wall biosynthesis
VNLPVCLSKLRSFKEILVVDSDSTDRTVDVAEAGGAKVIQFRWNGHFPKKRNWVLQNYQFLTDWVLFLDADEEITPAFELELATSIKNSRYSGFWIRYHNSFLGRKLRFGVPQRKLALFMARKGSYERIEENRWSDLDMEVHEHPIVNGAVGELGAPILHHDFKSLHSFIERHNDYSSWEAQRYVALRKAASTRLTIRQQLKYSLIASSFFPLAYFLFAYIIRGGFLDGRAGFHYAILKFAYFHQINLKIRELQIGVRP